MDKRQTPRIEYSCPVNISHPTLGEHSGMSTNISDTGVFVALDKALDLPVGIELEVQVVTGLPLPRRQLTQLVRQDRSGFGLRFLF